MALGPNPFASPASLPQASVMDQYPESGVRTAPGGNMGARDALKSFLNGQQKPALANPQMKNPTAGPRGALSTYITGGGAPVRGGVNGNGMGVRAPNVMRPTSAYR